MPRLMIITASTRAGRKGPLVAEWIRGVVETDAAWEIDPVDLAELALPFLDEPEHPRLHHYHHEHTRAWSRRVAAADAYLVVTPEYNYGPAPALINALDFVFHEWAYKPMAFVSYGGVSGGLRSVQALKLVVPTLKVMPLPDAVSIPFFTRFITEDGRFVPEERIAASAGPMLSELRKWSDALAGLRAGSAATAA